MGWMNDLVDTYNACESAVGLGDADKALLPLGFLLMKTQICVLLDKDGNFIKAEGSKNDEIYVIAPSTPKAEARTSNACAYPLFDNLGYIAPNDVEKNKLYIKELESWASGNQKLEVVLKYVKAGTILSDLERENIKVGNDKNIRFAVDIPGDNCSELWEDENIRTQWSKYCENIHTEIKLNNEQGLCYVTGELTSDIAKYYPKKINNKTGNAMLISANDGKNFTYRGRFTDPSQVLTIGYESTQKAHQALRWLINNVACKCDTQAIIAWQVNNAEKAEYNPVESYWDYYEDKTTDEYILSEVNTKINRTYAEKIRSALDGYGSVKGEHYEIIDIMAVDAATSGRMAVIFFEQLPKDIYLKTVANWQDTCAWHIKLSKKDEDDKLVRYEFFGAPSTDDIITAVHGEKCDEKIKKYERLRLLHCVFRGERLPRDLVVSAVNNASNPMSFRIKEKNKDKGWNYKLWEKVLAGACALTRKYIYDKNEKELYSMTLNEKNTDRDYLWGRLLALAEKIEKRALYEQRKKNGEKHSAEKRPTNALRYMSAFSAHPYKTWEIIEKQINPYKIMLNGADWYQSQIDEIISLFNDGEFEDNKALNGKYLMGYSLQRREFYNKNTNNQSEENENESE